MVDDLVGWAAPEVRPAVSGYDLGVALFYLLEVDSEGVGHVFVLFLEGFVVVELKLWDGFVDDCVEDLFVSVDAFESLHIYFVELETE